MPSVARRELEVNPWPLVFDIMEVRAFIRAKQAVESSKDEFSLPETYWNRWVWTVQGEIWRRGLFTKAR